MAEPHRVLIAGAWVEGADVTRELDPSNADDIVGVDSRAPFGGRKAPSLGPCEREGYAAAFFTRVETAYTDA